MKLSSILKWAVFFAVLSALAFSLGFYAGALGEQLGKNIVEICKSLMDADAALLGFLGLTTVFVLNNYRNSIYALKRELRDLNKQHSRRIALLSRKGYTNIKNPIGRTEEEMENSSYKETKNELEEQIKLMRSNAKFALLVAVISAFCLIASILSNLFTMSETPFTKESFGISVGTLFMGLAFMFSMILFSLEEIF